MFVIAIGCDAPPASVATFSIAGEISGTTGARGAPITSLALGDPDSRTAAITGDGPFSFVDVRDGTPYAIELPTGCAFDEHGAPGLGIVADNSIEGIQIVCDGYAALSYAVLTAPFDFVPSFAPMQLHYDATASLIVQTTSAELAGFYTHDVAVTFDGVRQYPASGACALDPCFGPWAIDGTVHELSATLDPGRDLSPRRYTVTLHTDAAPRQFGFGKGRYVAAQLGTVVAADAQYIAATMTSRSLGIAHGGDVIVYDRDGQSWRGGQLLLSSRYPSAQDRIGASLAIHGDRILVGAPGWNGTGAVFMFQHYPGGWFGDVFQSGSAPGDEFGASVAFAGDTVVIGAPGEGTGAGGVWTSVLGIYGSTTHVVPAGVRAADRFGAALCGTDGEFVVGAPGTNGGAGAAYIFAGGSSTTLAGTVLGGAFGAALACDAGRIIVGVPSAEQVLVVSGATTRVLSTPSVGEGFGTAVALAHGLLAIGAPLADSGGGAAYPLCQRS